MGRPLRVLIVEDSQDDAELLLRELRLGGYDPTSERVDTPEAMEAALQKQAWDIVISDYVLPHFNGSAAMALLKQSGFDLPFILVTGSIGEDTAVTVMKAGAHDCLLKGNLKRLVPAIERELKEAVERKERRCAEAGLRMRVRQQAVIAELGQRALKGADLLRLMNDAVALIASTLNVEYCKILELLPKGDALRLIAGVGWKAGFVGSATVGAERDSQAGYTLTSDGPVIVEDLRTETRFHGPPLLLEHNVVSGLSVIIHGPDRSFGVLGAHTAQKRKFTQDDVHFLQAVANTLADAIQRQRSDEALRESNTRLRLLIERMPAVLWTTDNELRITSHVGAGLAGLNLSPNQLVGMTVSEYLRTDDPNQIIIAVHRRAVAGEAVTAEIGWLGRTFHAHIEPLRDAEGRPAGCIGVALDITERKHAEGALQESEHRFADMLNIAADAIIAVDETQRITLFNKGAERLFGHRAAEVLGQPLDLLLPARFAAAHREHIRAFAAAPETARLMQERTAEIYGLRKDGTEFPADASISKLFQDGKTIFIVILRDITERTAQAATLRHQATHDALTGLPNRTLLRDRLQQAILAGQRQNKPVALLLMDLDRFKEINDTLGHHRGDLLLQQVGRRLRDALREYDMVARLGGDEFALLLPLMETRHATLVAQKIFKVLEQPFVIEGLPIAVEPSIGIALYPEHGENGDMLMQRADVAMYEAKQTGSGWIIYNATHDRHSPRRLALMAELRQAIESSQLVLHYQPKIDLPAGRVTGMEALVRWQHPEHGSIPPDQFILPAERTGLIRPLTRWILNAALGQCRSWREAGWDIPVAVNLSARNLSDPQLPAQIVEMLQTHGIAPDRLELEITESMIMAEPALALEILTRLSRAGMKFSIDDFGTGYSSLGYLNKLPVHEIKIDRSFVGEMTASEDNVTFVRSIIELGHNLGLKVVAEGVETKAILDRLISLGCDAAQGYYISRPMPADELTRWLQGSPWGFGRTSH